MQCAGIAQEPGCARPREAIGLQGLLHLRQCAVDTAQQVLIACLRAETAAGLAAAEADRTIARELAAAAASTDDAAVEALAVWLPQGREQAAAARAFFEAAQRRTACARAALTACRAAQDSAENDLAGLDGHDEDPGPT